MIAQVADAGSLARVAAQRRRLVLGLVIVAAPLAGWLAGTLSEGGQTLSLALLLLVLAPVVAWWRLPVAVLGLAFTGVVIEQFNIGAPGGDLTDHIALYTSLNTAIGLSGIYFDPLEIVMAGVLVALLGHIGLRRQRLPRSALAFTLASLLMLVGLGAVHGLFSGGDFKQALVETRPLLYLGVMYLLVSQLPGRVAYLHALLWTFIAVVAVKSLQGAVLVLTQVLPAVHRPDYLLGHEDSLFLSVFVNLVAGLWLFGRRGRMRTLATIILPFAFLTDVANNRRAGWLMLGAGFLALLLLAAVRLPERRRLVVGVLSGLAFGFAVYLPIFWNQDGGILGGPARAIKSQISPGVRDLASNLYRQGENLDLAFDIRRSPLLGTGFGIPIPHPIPLVNLSRIDPSIDFVPHDTVLYIWLRLGSPGAFIFWMLIGFAMLVACRLVRSRNLDISLYGAFAVCALIAYVAEGYVDMGLAFLRIAVFIGVVLGGLEVGRRAEVDADTESTGLEGTGPGRWRPGMEPARGSPGRPASAV